MVETWVNNAEVEFWCGLKDGTVAKEAEWVIIVKVLRPEIIIRGYLEGSLSLLAFWSVQWSWMVSYGL